MSIAYKAGYKYQLYEDYMGSIQIKPDTHIELGPINLNSEGTLYIERGYSWDGPSGPTFDTATFMRGSLVHDALYELMRHGLIPQEMKEAADRELQRICIEDGMWKIRAWWVYIGVKLGGKKSTLASGRKRIFYAP